MRRVSGAPAPFTAGGLTPLLPVSPTGGPQEPTYNAATVGRWTPMATLQDLAERIERLLLRHEEVKRTNSLLEEQLTQVSHERDNLKSRLSAARSRIDALLERLPANGPDARE